ncbi:hypothetical protein ACLD02_16410 [Alloalcanivorax sp. C16-2]|uniref:hypothetical protein n=1 Tax=Alloalcanivorax sp. C16-2 TaxID=3390052 RepID=UPI00397092E0
MDPAITELLHDALKILGPALVTGFVGYKAASLQFRATLEKIREGNEFSARQHLFDYYKERQKRFSDSYANLLNQLGQILGINAATFGTDLDESTSAIVDTFNAQVRLHLGAAPFELALLLRDMKSKKLDKTEEFKDLEDKRNSLETLELADDYPVTRN